MKKMQLNSDGSAHGAVSGRWGGSVILSAVILSAVSALGGAYFGYLSASRQSDVEAAKLAISIIQSQPEGDKGVTARRFGIDLLVRSTGIEINSVERAAWVNGTATFDLLGSAKSLQLMDLTPCNGWSEDTPATEAELVRAILAERTGRLCANIKLSQVKSLIDPIDPVITLQKAGRLRD
ncbi:hypothetical protein D2T31_05045 [Sinirhodobacter populi]|uniref:Uncharacterized protein n=1 Tax=Paenirhodobacter populi TaxID=2306993 RepID=A0A443KEW3_9RHOB|nr:hypothetical protein [Sinirhodobacter populi]RWR25509.1 hypothetical protein D2T31_21800 [Sinirhodobacter populi]RWR31367.1 hypothetical protein D2T31_05045 [Sinirhodobacter populi]